MKPIYVAASDEVCLPIWLHVPIQMMVVARPKAASFHPFILHPFSPPHRPAQYRRRNHKKQKKSPKPIWLEALGHQDEGACLNPLLVAATST